MGGTLTVQQDTRTDPVFDEFMETVRINSYSFFLLASGIVIMETNISDF